MVSRARRRVRLSVLLLGVALAGCLGGPVPTPLTGGSGSPTLPDEEDPAVVIETADLNKTYEWRAGNLTFQNALQRYRIVADANATLDVSWNTLLGRYAEKEDCFVLAAYDSVDEDGMMATQWASKLAYEVDVQVMGEPYAFNVQRYAGSTGMGSSAQGRLNLTRGEALVLVLGGRSHEYLQWPVLDSSFQPHPPTMDLVVNASGPTHLERLPDARLRCGVGPEQAQALAQATTLAAGVTVAANLTLEARNATSLWAKEVVAFDTPHEGTALYRDDRIALGEEIRRSERGGGTVGLEFLVWADVLAATPAWLLADAELPFLLWGSE